MSGPDTPVGGHTWKKIPTATVISHEVLLLFSTNYSSQNPRKFSGPRARGSYQCSDRK